MITAIQIDSREPEWVQKLTFNGIPTIVQYMEHADIMAACDDGSMILVERKTPDDFLGSLKSGRLFPQLAPLYYTTKWAYLMITGELSRGANDKVITERGVTGWSWNAVQGALLSIQEMGVMVTFCNGDADFEAAILRLGNRDHSDTLLLRPPKFPQIISPKEMIIASLPGIGIERMKTVMDFSGGNPSVALQILTDPHFEIPNFPNGIKKMIRQTLMLADKTELVMVTKDTGEEYLSVEKTY